MAVKAALFLSDTQVGHICAIAPDNFMIPGKSEQEGPRPLGLNAAQKYLLECWNDLLKRSQKLLDHYGLKKFTALVDVGDTIDGRQWGQAATECWSADPADQVLAAEALWERPREMADVFVVLRGNDYHEGKSGRDLEHFGQHLHARSYHGRYCFPGFITDVKLGHDKVIVGVTHEPGNPQVYFGTALDKQGLFAKATSGEGFPDPDVMVFGHLHKWMGTEHPGKRVIINGAWQIQTWYTTMKGRFWRWRKPDIGGTIMVLDNESVDYKITGDPIRIIKVLYKVPKQTIHHL